MIVTENITIEGNITWTPMEVTIEDDVNDYDVTTTTVYITPTKNLTITGFSYDPEMQGKMLWIRNRSSTFTITLEYDSSSSASDHRIFTDTATDITIPPLKRISLLYDNGWWTV